MDTTKKYHTGRIVSTLIIVIVAVVVGYRWGNTEAQSVQVPTTLTGVYNPNATTTDFTLFWKVWNLLDQKYADTKNRPPITDQEKLYGAIQGLAAAYGDPYTTFFPPEETKSFESEIEGSFEGVGMEVSIKDDILTVVAPLKGSPAEKAGILPGDKILKIDDTLTNNLTIDESIKLIKGKKGTVVRITILRAQSDHAQEISVTRDVISIPTIETEVLPNGIFSIRLYSFTAQSPGLFQQAIRQFVLSGNKKLIIDLRGNPGGYLDAAVDMASWFLPVGSTVVTEEFKGGVENVYHRSKGYNVIGNDVKTIILVDGGSASAAEILAGALREYNKAQLVGAKTFGKGSVQEYMSTSADTSLKITVARWLTPKGVSISEGGLIPDVEVKVTQEDIAAKKDAQFLKAVELLSR